MSTKPSVSVSDTIPPQTPTPSPFTYIVSFLLVGLCWGFTTPFIRRAALHYSPPTLSSSQTDPSRPWISRQLSKVFFTVLGLLRTPSYAIPLVLNLTGSIWFFLLVGKAELSLTVPITNSLAFLFTVLGEWLAEGKMIDRSTWAGMALVCGGIALCVSSKKYIQWFYEFVTAKMNEEIKTLFDSREAAATLALSSVDVTIVAAVSPRVYIIGQVVAHVQAKKP